MHIIPKKQKNGIAKHKKWSEEYTTIYNQLISSPGHYISKQYVKRHKEGDNLLENLCSSLHPNVIQPSNIKIAATLSWLFTREMVYPKECLQYLNVLLRQETKSTIKCKVGNTFFLVFSEARLFISNNTQLQVIFNDSTTKEPE